MLSLSRMIGSVTEVVRTCHDLLLNGRKRERNDYPDVDDFDCEIGTMQFEVSVPKRRNVVQGSELVANAEHIDRILGWLGNGDVTIGVFGMGGIGKTTLSKQLHAELQNLYADTVNFTVVAAWVSVGMEFSVGHLQLKIAKAFGLDLRDENDVTRRSAVLNSFLSRSPKPVLILDDVWGDFRREQVGIPNYCQLVLISRSMDICRIMRCQKLIKVEPLQEEYAWRLFSRSLDRKVLDSEEITRIARLLCLQCAGVPLAIISLAESMAGLADVSSWRTALGNINRISEGLSALENTITVLKRSYDTLSAPKVKMCFLYCALYPEGYLISEEELIRLWIGEMLIDDVLPLQAQYDMGHSILRKLLNSCLLESCGDNNKVKMHNLVRYMALSISRDMFMVKDAKPLTRIGEFEWREALRVVSLINTNFQIPSVTSFKVHNLSTLLLQHNPLPALPDAFFLGMPSLRILSLSDTPIDRLPSSIRALEELRILDVSWCVHLKQVPSLAKLQKLKILDISHTAIEEVPIGIGKLKSLTELHISSIPELSKFPLVMLSSLSRLRRLACDVGIVDELQRLESIEILDARFVNLTDLRSYVRSQHWRSLESYHLQVGCDVGIKGHYRKGISLHNCSVIGQDGENIVLPDDTRELNVDGCKGFRSLSDVINPFNAASGTNSCQITLGVPSNIRVGGFRVQFGTFSSLEKCTISRCPDVEKLFTTGFIRNIQHIEIIEVQDCGQLKGLIVDEVGVKRDVLNLPQLKRIALSRLPQLNCIYEGQLLCTSLQYISLEDCPKLNRLPFSFVDDGKKLCPSSLICDKSGGSYWNGANLTVKLC